jgi:hypothetical protein
VIATQLFTTLPSLEPYAVSLDFDVVREVFNPTKDLASLYPVERTSSRALQQAADSPEVTSSRGDPDMPTVDPVQLRLDERRASEAVMRSVGALGN